MKKQNVRTLSLIVGTFTYLLVGAAIFDSLESRNASQKAEVLNTTEHEWLARHGVTEQDRRILEALILRGVPHKAGNQWKFAGAFYYATTVLTTIGYGHSTPNTVYGKVFTILYAVVGIPLCLVLFHSIGERLNKVFSMVIRSIKRALKLPSSEVTDIDLILAVTTLSTLTITSGAAVFSSYENWSYFDSVYYCVITLTTIGFGDMVALQKNEALEKQPEYVAFSLLFILFGMAIVAACLNLFVLRLVTMNTEDERRDEAEALQAAAGAVRLEGDVITANGSIISIGEPDTPTPGGGGGGGLGSSADNNSVCSCTCISCAPLDLFSRNRYSRRRKPKELSRLRRQQRRSVSQLSYTGRHTVRRAPSGPLSGIGGISQGITQEDICSMASSSESTPRMLHIPLQTARNSV